MAEVVRGKKVATEFAADLLAPRLAVGLGAFGDAVAKAGDFDGLGPRGVRGEARDEDRAQIHGYRELVRDARRLVTGAELGVCSNARLRAWRGDCPLYRAFCALDEPKYLPVEYSL